MYRCKSRISRSRKRVQNWLTVCLAASNIMLHNLHTSGGGSRPGYEFLGPEPRRIVRRNLLDVRGQHLCHHRQRHGQTVDGPLSAARGPGALAEDRPLGRRLSHRRHESGSRRHALESNDTRQGELGSAADAGKMEYPDPAHERWSGRCVAPSVMRS